MVDVLKYKNVIVSTLVSTPVMAWLWIFTGFSALWLTEVYGLIMGVMGGIMAASGVGTCMGNLLSLGALFDNIGRKKPIIINRFLYSGGFDHSHNACRDFAVCLRCIILFMGRFRETTSASLS